MSLKGVTITKGAVGSNTTQDDTSVSGFLFTGPEVEDVLEHGKAYTLYSVDDAEDLGITESYDEENSVRMYRQIYEFYRKAGDNTELYILVAPQTTTMSELVQYDGDYAPLLVAKAKGEIRQLGVSINPDSDYEVVMLDGLNSEVVSAISKAQALGDWCFENHRPLHILLEGRDYGGTASVALNLREIENVEATDVSVVIGQDYDYADGLDEIGQTFADVGTALGDVAYMAVNECIGEVETMNLTDSGLGSWESAGLSSHQNIEDVEDDLQTLDTKGYIFGVSYTGVSGFRWNDDHVCVEEVEDAQGNLNESSIAYSRTLKEATRVLYKALIVKVKTVQPVDSDTGLLPVGVIKYFEGLGNTALSTLSDVLSGYETTVDPDSNLLTGDKSLDVSFVIVPYGKVGEINGTINLKSSI